MCALEKTKSPRHEFLRIVRHLQAILNDLIDVISNKSNGSASFFFVGFVFRSRIRKCSHFDTHGDPPLQDYVFLIDPFSAQSLLHDWLPLASVQGNACSSDVAARLPGLAHRAAGVSVLAKQIIQAPHVSKTRPCHCTTSAGPSFPRTCSRASPSSHAAALCRRWRLAITKLVLFRVHPWPGAIMMLQFFRAHPWSGASAGVNYQHGTELIMKWGSSAASA